MRSLFKAYDAYINRAAQQPAQQRLRLLRLWSAPLLLAFIGLKVAMESLGVPFAIGVGVLVAVSVMLVVVVWDATSRFIRYGWTYDRTPVDTSWADPDHGVALLAALRRMSLNDLRSVTARTRLKGDMRFTNGDIAELLRLLASDGHLSEAAIDRLRVGDPTIQAVLDDMAGVR